MQIMSVSTSNAAWCGKGPATRQCSQQWQQSTDEVLSAMCAIQLLLHVCQYECRYLVRHRPSHRAVLMRVAAVSMEVASAYSLSAVDQSFSPSASSAYSSPRAARQCLRAVLMRAAAVLMEVASAYSLSAVDQSFAFPIPLSALLHSCYAMP